MTDADIKAYYDKNKAQFEQPIPRGAAHRQKQRSAPTTFHSQLQSGGDFAKLAKQYSQDPSSADKGGKYTAVKGQSVEEFDKFVFDAEIGDSEPVKTQFGYHVIEVLSDVKPKSTTPLKMLRSRSATRSCAKQNEAMRKWVNDLEAKYADQIAYAPGFAPPASQTTGETTATEQGWRPRRLGGGSRRPARACRAATPRLSLGPRADGAHDRSPYGRGGLRGRRSGAR